MGEKSPRRAPMNFTAEKLDYKESVARTDNKRAHNRLAMKKSDLRDHEHSKLSTMNYEMRRLKHELRGIKQTSGYFYVEDEMKRDRKKEKRSKGNQSTRKRQNFEANCEEFGNRDNCKQTSGDTNLNLNLPNLPRITSSSTLCGLGNETETKKGLIPDSYGSENQMNSQDKLGNSYANRSGTIAQSSQALSENCTAVVLSDTSVENNQRFEGNTLRPASRELSKSDTSLVLNLDEARDRIQNRLAGRHMAKDDTDLTPYMHVPPDGLPRTLYLLPPLEDLLKEAKKARYVRKLRKRHVELEQDDPERELNIDEIFNRK